MIHCLWPGKPSRSSANHRISGDGVGGDDIDGNDNSDKNEVGSGGGNIHHVQCQHSSIRHLQLMSLRLIQNAMIRMACPHCMQSFNHFGSLKSPITFYCRRCLRSSSTTHGLFCGTPKHCVMRSHVPTAIGHSSNIEMSSGPTSVSTPHVSSG